jgi:DNA-directed RNA polymerase specialized sigma24 family protein
LGDIAAKFRTAYERFRADGALARRLVPTLSEADREDVIEAALLKFWMALNKGLDISDVDGFLRRLIKQHAISLRKRRPRELPAGPFPGADIPDPELPLEGHYAAMEALARLPNVLTPLERKVFLADLLETPRQEAAQALMISDKAYRRLRSEARTKLAELADGLPATTLSPVLSVSSAALNEILDRLHANLDRIANVLGRIEQKLGSV